MNCVEAQWPDAAVARTRHLLALGAFRSSILLAPLPLSAGASAAAAAFGGAARVI